MSSTNQPNSESNFEESPYIETKVLDNPCWGDIQPEKQNLFYFLQLIDAGYFRVHSLSSSSCSSALSTLTPCNNDATNHHEIIVQSLINNNIILHNDDNYLVLNKPPDVRMDGSHLTTVHKLVTLLFPPPSILRKVHETAHQNEDENLESSNDSTSSPASIVPIIKNTYYTKLIHVISKISHHGETKDNIMRNTHQLDYATSGTLLLAKNKQAAALACKMFEVRSTQKEYLALVHGNVIQTLANIPFLNQYQYGVYQDWMNGTIEKNDQKERLNKKGGKKKKFTFEGYMPTHTVFGKWKSIRIRRRDGKYMNEERNKRKRKHNDDYKNDFLINEEVESVDEESSDETKARLQQKLLESKLDEEKEMKIWNQNPASIFTTKDEQILTKLTWKEIKKSQDKSFKKFFESLAKEINDFYRIKHEEEIQKEKDRHDQEMKDLNKRLPTVFRLSPIEAGDVCESNSKSSQKTDEKVFYVQIPIAVANDDRFQMVVHPDFLSNETFFLPKELREQIISQYSIPLSLAKELEFKPSLTKCTVQQVGVWNSQHVTKILLQPRTGRRHQLRLHMAIIRHAIKGDIAYEPNNTHGAELLASDRVTGDRMCLHAHKLTLPLDDEDRKKTFIAPDPFTKLV